MSHSPSATSLYTDERAMGTQLEIITTTHTSWSPAPAYGLSAIDAQSLYAAPSQ
jgi:hypothetical protein